MLDQPSAQHGKKRGGGGGGIKLMNGSRWFGVLR